MRGAKPGDVVAIDLIELTPFGSGKSAILERRIASMREVMAVASITTPEDVVRRIAAECTFRGAKRLAATQPIGKVPVAICYGSGVVVGGVERLPIHRAINDHAGLRTNSTG